MIFVYSLNLILLKIQSYFFEDTIYSEIKHENYLYLQIQNEAIHIKQVMEQVIFQQLMKNE